MGRISVTKPIPEDVSERLKPLLKQIADLYQTSRITIIVRAPEGGNAVGDLVFSNDNPTMVAKTLHAHMVAEAQRFAAEGKRSGVDAAAEFPKHSYADRIYPKD